MSEDLKNKERPPESMREAVLVRRIPSLERSLFTTMKGFDRRTELINAVYRAFANESPVFELTESVEVDRYVNRKDLASLRDSARAEGYDYVLVLYEGFVGLASDSVLQTRAGLLRPAVNVNMILHDALGREPLYRRNLRAIGGTAANYEDAVNNQRFFGAQWPGLSTRIANDLVSELLYADRLHAMAERVGRGAEVPAAGTILANYGKRLHWDLKSAKGWRMRKASSDFTRVFDQKDETAPFMQVRFDVDLTIPEFGQDVHSIGEYLPLYEKRRAEQSGGASVLTPFADITAPGFTAYFVGSEQGAGEIVLFRKIDETAMQIVNARFARDFAGLYPGNRASIERLIVNGQVRLESSPAKLILIASSRDLIAGCSVLLRSKSIT